MDFRYNDEQLAMQATLQRFIERDYDFAARRALATSASGYSAAAWAQYAELGLLALPLPEALGGLGGGAEDRPGVSRMTLGVEPGLVVVAYD